MLQLNDVSKQYGSKLLFENASAFIGPESRIALIGPNGAGKTTLLRLLTGAESPDSGAVSRTRNMSIGYLAQEVPKTSERTVLGEVMRLDGRREELLELRRSLEEEFERDTASEAGLKRYGRVLEELEHLDEFRLEARAKEILSGMGFKPGDLHRSLTEFSGGWLMRVALSRILLMDPDLLLLDEPTNHLDLESLLWLEEFLREYHGAILAVSHDTRFLNGLVTEVLEVDGRKLTHYTGNLHSFAAQKEERLRLLEAQYAGQQAKIAEIERFVSRFGAKATKARQAQSRLKQLEKMELIELPESRAGVRFRFPPAPHSGKEVVTMEHVAMSYGTPGTAAEKVVFRDFNWVLQRGSRTAIVGVNGAGKTTLLRLLTGALSPTRGKVKHGHLVQVGYYAQLQTEALDLSKTIYEELQSAAPAGTTISQLRGIAGAFLFSGDAIEKKCSVLSGGEKARVALAKLLLTPTNFLVLDEPTNHLDVESRGVLLDALQDYEGTLCIVSHDREFISPLADSVLEIVPSDKGPGSSAIPLVCNYEEYLERKLREVREARKVPAARAAAAKASEPPTQRELNKVSFNQKRTWEREREKLEAEITKLESRQAELGQILSDPAVYDDRAKAMALVEEQKKVGESLGAKLTRWEEVCQLLGE